MSINELAKPFYYPGGERGCLLIHGFTGSPSEMKDLGLHLSSYGLTVRGVLLKGHGICPEVMAKTDWKQWYQSVQIELQKLKEECPVVYVVGLSMGGLLALYTAAHHEISGVVSMNAPIFLQNTRIKQVPFLRFIKRYEKMEKTYDGSDHFCYDRVPLTCVSSLLKFIKVTQKDLTNINVPASILQSKIDPTVVPESGQYIYEHISSAQKELVWLESNDHLVTKSSIKEEVFEHVAQFVLSGLK